MFSSKWVAIAAVVVVSACTAEQRADFAAYCDRNPAVCVLAGAVVLAGVVGAVAASSHNPHNPSFSPPPQPSDRRLKTDIRPVGTLASGIRLYAFRYRGDDNVFVSVMAQDLLADPRFRHAVSVDAKGYYRVDMTALDLDVVNGSAMLAAGERAEQRPTVSRGN